MKKRDNMQQLPNLLVTSREASDILKIPQGKLGELVNAGLIPCLIIGSRKFRLEALEDFLKKYEGWDLSDPFNPQKITT